MFATPPSPSRAPAQPFNQVRMPLPPPPPPPTHLVDADTITFNVGGTHFQLALSTLLASSLPPTCFLREIVREHQRNMMSANKATPATSLPKHGYFIDRDPVVFAALVAFCRTGIWERPPSVGPRLFQAELQGYGVEWEEQLDEPQVSSNDKNIDAATTTATTATTATTSLTDLQSDSELDSDDDGFVDDDDEEEDDDDGDDGLAGPTVPSAAQELEALLAADVAYAVHTGAAAAMAPGVVDRVKREKLNTTVALFAGLCEREGLECIPALAATNIVPASQWADAVAAVQASSLPRDLLVDILFGYSFSMYRLGQVPAALRILTLSKRCGFDNAAADTLTVVIEDSQSNALKAATSGVVLAAALGAIYYFWKQ